MMVKDSDDFTSRTAHILLSLNLSDIEKLQCIKLIYRELAFPEYKKTKEDEALLERI